YFPKGFLTSEGQVPARPPSRGVLRSAQTSSSPLRWSRACQSHRRPCEACPCCRHDSTCHWSFWRSPGGFPRRCRLVSSDKSCAQKNPFQEFGPCPACPRQSCTLSPLNFEPLQRR